MVQYNAYVSSLDTCLNAICRLLRYWTPRLWLSHWQADSKLNTQTKLIPQFAVAAEVTEEFLDFSAQRGNDLRSVSIDARAAANG
jgi:hypothetical protein